MLSNSGAIQPQLVGNDEHSGPLRPILARISGITIRGNGESDGDDYDDEDINSMDDGDDDGNDDVFDDCDQRATLFTCNEDPKDVFKIGMTKRGPQIPCQFPRFLHRNNPRIKLIYTDGACLGNGQANPRAGAAFVYRDSHPRINGFVKLRLENEGPSGKPHAQTSNRAELRAVLAALQFRYWPGENTEVLVIATDSVYVANGCTDWVYKWKENDWNTRNGPVKNRDLWEALLKEFNMAAKNGMQIKFWRIPRELNAEADNLARAGALGDERFQYCKILGVMV